MTTGADPVLTAIGMTTPVGLTAAQSCAAIRAGISAIAELNYVVENDDLAEVPLMGCAVRGLLDGYAGLGRWTRLATAALRDLVSATGLSQRDLASAALYLALPPVDRGGFDSRIPELLGPRIAQWMGVEALAAKTRAYADGHAAAARACADAMAHVAQGAVARAIVCGVDSLIESETLEYFLAKRRVKTEDHIDGFVPGEAAACLLIESRAVAEARGAPVMAVIDAASTATEPITVWSDDPSAATGLSEAIRGTLAQLSDKGLDTRLVVTDLNGETYRAREFGTTAARVLSGLPSKWTVWHPADCIGDTGAAAFPVSICVAARALAKGYAKGDRALILGSSDDGLRGTVSLRRVPTSG